MIYARKRTPHREYRPARPGFRGARETVKQLIKLSIQLYLAWLSPSNTVCVFEVSGVKRARSAVHNWIYKADLQPESGRSPVRVAVDETVIRLDDEQYWLYAAVDPELNELAHTKLEPTITKVLATGFIRELREKHDVDDAVFLIDRDLSFQYACGRLGLEFRYERYGDRNSAERISIYIIRRITSFSNCFSNATLTTVDQWLNSFAFEGNQLIWIRPSLIIRDDNRSRSVRRWPLPEITVETSPTIAEAPLNSSPGHQPLVSPAREGPSVRPALQAPETPRRRTRGQPPLQRAPD